jgi:hypothetical protein
VTLTFDLHNRHTYSEELAKTSRGYRRYTAMVGLLASDNTPLGRAAVVTAIPHGQGPLRSHFRRFRPWRYQGRRPQGVEPVTIVIPATSPPRASASSV